MTIKTTNNGPLYNAQPVSAPSQEPVAWCVYLPDDTELFTSDKVEAYSHGRSEVMPLYTAMPDASAQIADLESRYSERQRDAEYFERRVCEQSEQIAQLQAAARAVVNRWDTPLWKDVPATATYINALREALGEKECQ